eukprot:gene7629-8924_t
MKDNLIQLVHDGQFEFVNGGSVMTDEGMAHYTEFVDQLSEGSKWVNFNFGGKITSAFNVNTYGHSEAIAHFLASAGVKNIVVSKINRDVKSLLLANNHLEFRWQSSAHNAHSAPFDLFAHVLPEDDIGIRYTCGQDPTKCEEFEFASNDSQQVNIDNVHKMSMTLLEQYRGKALQFRTNQLLIPFGDISMFSDLAHAKMVFDNYEKLFEEINQSSNLKTHVRWSTLGEYFSGIESSQYPIGLAPVLNFGEQAPKEHEVVPGAPVIPDTREFSVYKGDFFSYSDKEEQFYTAHFSSIPNIRMLAKQTTNLLHTAQTFHSILSLNLLDKTTDLSTFAECKSNLTMFQQSPSFSGHAKDSFYNHLASNFETCQQDLGKILARLSASAYECKDSSLNMKLVGDSVTNPTTINLLESEDQSQTIFVYNPTETKKDEIVRFFVDTPNFIVRNSLETPIACQLNPVWEDFETSIVPLAKKFEAIFIATTTPLSISSFTIEARDKAVQTTMPATSTILAPNHVPLESKDFEPFVINQAKLGTQDIYLDNSAYNLKIRHESGLIERVSVKRGSQVDDVKFESMNMLFAHTSAPKDAFVMANGDVHQIRTPTVLIRHVKGVIVDEVVVYKDKTSPFKIQRIQLVDCLVSLNRECPEESSMILYESTIDYSQVVTEGDPILRLSIASATSSNTEKKAVFYTDNNGYSLMARRINPHSRYNTKFLPMSAVTYVGEANSVSGYKLGVFTRMPLGVASANEGMLDVLMNRHRMSESKMASPAITVPLWINLAPNVESVPGFPHQSSRVINTPAIVQHRVGKFPSAICTATSFMPMLDLPSGVQLVSIAPLEDDYIYMRMLNTGHHSAASSKAGNKVPLKVGLPAVFPQFQFNDLQRSNLIFTEFESYNDRQISLPTGQLVSVFARIKYQPGVVVIHTEVPSEYLANPRYVENKDAVPRAFSPPMIDPNININIQKKQVAPPGMPNSPHDFGFPPEILQKNIEAAKDFAFQDHIVRPEEVAQPMIKKEAKRIQPPGIDSVHLEGQDQMNKFLGINKAHNNVDAVPEQSAEIKAQIAKEREALKAQADARKQEEEKKKTMATGSKKKKSLSLEEQQALPASKLAAMDYAAVDKEIEEIHKKAEAKLPNHQVAPSDAIVATKVTGKQMTEVKMTGKEMTEVKMTGKEMVDPRMVEENAKLEELLTEARKTNVRLADKVVLMEAELAERKHIHEEEIKLHRETYDTHVSKLTNSYADRQVMLNESHVNEIIYHKQNHEQAMRAKLIEMERDYDTKVRELTVHLEGIYRPKLDDLSTRVKELEEINTRLSLENFANSVTIKEFEERLAPKPGMLEKLLSKSMQVEVTSEPVPLIALTPLQRNLKTLEREITSQINIFKRQISDMRKKAPNPFHVHTKEVSIKLLQDQLGLIEKVRQQIKENPDMANKPLDQFYDGQVLLGKKSFLPPTARPRGKSGTSLFYAMSFFFAGLTIIYLAWVIYRQRTRGSSKEYHKALLSSPNGASTGLSSSSSIARAIFSSGHQEEKFE